MTDLSCFDWDVIDNATGKVSFYVEKLFDLLKLFFAFEKNKLFVGFVDRYRCTNLAEFVYVITTYDLWNSHSTPWHWNARRPSSTTITQGNTVPSKQKKKKNIKMYKNNKGYTSHFLTISSLTYWKLKELPPETKISSHRVMYQHHLFRWGFPIDTGCTL